MAGGNFMHRVLSYVINEVLVEGLANNRSFQRFAVRTSRKMEDLSKTVNEKKEVLSRKLEENLRNRE